MCTFLSQTTEQTDKRIVGVGFKNLDLIDLINLRYFNSTAVHESWVVNVSIADSTLNFDFPNA